MSFGFLDVECIERETSYVISQRRAGKPVDESLCTNVARYPNLYKLLTEHDLADHRVGENLVLMSSLIKRAQRGKVSGAAAAETFGKMVLDQMVPPK